MRKTLYFCLFSSLFSADFLLAQTNYVANSANSATPSNYNTLVGPAAGNTTMTGAENVFVGYQAGNSNTEGRGNSIIGYQAGLRNTTGYYNTFLGHQSGYNGTYSAINTFVGYQSGYYNSGSNNIFIGDRSGYWNYTGSHNTFLGSLAGYNNRGASSNVFVGEGSGFYNTEGQENTFVGTGTGYNSTTGNNNVFLGYGVGLNNTTGFANTFLGYKSGSGNTIGNTNVFIGSFAGFNNTTGQSNMFLGQQAGAQNTTASYNMFVGNSSGSSTTTGLGNTAIGDGSLLRNKTGIQNTAIGRYAGVESTGDENVFIGFAADINPATPDLTNVVVIGARARVSQSNSIVLGANANVGIGNSAPTAKLHVTSGSANTSGLRLENLTNTSTASVLNQTKFLTVDASGNVILGSLNGSGRLGADQWTNQENYLQNTNEGGVVIGKGINHTPSDYNLFVSKGILTEKVKVAVKNTNEWSDKVFEQSYVLKSLSEVEQYIKQTGHLPNVPSAQQMVEQGNDLHKTDAKLLEKIEELTLYSIQLEKKSADLEKASQIRSQQQQAEIDELKRLVKQLMNNR